MVPYYMLTGKIVVIKEICENGRVERTYEDEDGRRAILNMKDNSGQAAASPLEN